MNRKICFLSFFLFDCLEIKADKYPIKNYSNKYGEILIESNKQSSDLINSIFFAEGDVIITNNNKEFIAKSKKAIFYKLSGKIKLIGNVEIITSDLNKIKAGEILYYLKDNKFEAISDQDQRVKTKFVLDED